MELPLLFGRSKAKELRSIKERLWFRIHGRGGRLLSNAGRAVMIQAMGQAIPLYAMNCFKLPSGFLHELDMMLARFWWEDVGSKRKVHWKKMGLVVLLKA